MSYQNILTYLIAILPILLITYIFVLPNDVINPISYLINISGHISIIFLFLTLFTSRIEILKKNLNRKLIVLTSFSYLLVHVILYFFDNNFNYSYVKDDLVSLKYIQVGYIAMILYLPLVISSNNFVKLLLGSLWKSIHKTIYIIMGLSLIHYFLVIKADYLIIYFYLFLTLFVLLKSSKIQKHGP